MNWPASAPRVTTDAVRYPQDMPTEARTWCTNCRVHVAYDKLCPVCIDNERLAVQ